MALADPVETLEVEYSPTGTVGDEERFKPIEEEAALARVGEQALGALGIDLPVLEILHDRHDRRKMRRRIDYRATVAVLQYLEPMLGTHHGHPDGRHPIKIVDVPLKGGGRTFVPWYIKTDGKWLFRRTGCRALFPSTARWNACGLRRQ